MSVQSLTLNLIFGAASKYLGIDVAGLVDELRSGQITQELEAGKTIASVVARYVPVAAQVQQALSALEFINTILQINGVQAHPATVAEMEAIHPAFNPNAGV